MWSDGLIRLLGYECTTSKMAENKDDAVKLAQELIPVVKEEINAGRPVLAWHAFTAAEWDVICGFDDETHEFIGRGSYAGMDDYARADQERMASAVDICPAFGIIRIREKTSEFNAREAEVAALKEAVRHGRLVKEEAEPGKWVMFEGMQCYDRWISEFRDDPERKRGLGDAYCLGIYQSTHRAASGFLKEIAPNYPEASENLLEAAESFLSEAEVLVKSMPLLWWNSPEGPDLERNAEAAVLLAQAWDHYAKGIESIESGLEAINVKDVV
jgi:hypothetical protein